MNDDVIDKLSDCFRLDSCHISVEKGKSNSEQMPGNLNRDYLNIPGWGWCKTKENLLFSGHINYVTVIQQSYQVFAVFNIVLTKEEYERTHTEDGRLIDNRVSRKVYPKKI